MFDIHESFLTLVRQGIGIKNRPLPESVNWAAIKTLADEQGLTAILLDGMERLNMENTNHTDTIPLPLKLNWIGEVIQGEMQYVAQRKTAKEMGLLFHKNDIRTYVLKGLVVAEGYPKPDHRPCSDMDCFLLPLLGQFNAWEKGNKLVEQAGYKVKKDHYKNSTFYLPNLIVENHKFFTPFRGNKLMRRLEIVLQKLIQEDDGKNKIGDTCLYRPPIMVTAIFLIEHAYSHFLHEGLTWRHVLDWMMYSRKYKEVIDWEQLEIWIDEYGLRKFYDSYYRLGLFLLGEKSEDELSELDKMMEDDIWAPLDLHETVRGFKGKLALAGNTWRARWKYREFTDVSWLKALWIQMIGFLFIKNPKLTLEK